MKFECNPPPISLTYVQSEFGSDLCYDLKKEDIWFYFFLKKKLALKFIQDSWSWIEF